MGFKITTGSMRAAGVTRQVIFRFTSKHGARRWFFDVWVEAYSQWPFIKVFVRWGRRETVTTVGVCWLERMRRGA